MQKLIYKLDNDILLVSWLHAVNSYNRLTDALNSSVDCLETDLVYNKSNQTIYHCHPPEEISDITFHQYWNICKNSNKILKLDFKSIEAVEPALKVLLDSKCDSDRFILNADILGSSAVQYATVDGTSFLLLTANTDFHLSLGWTVGPTNSVGYTWADVIAMCDILKSLPTTAQTSRMVSLPVDSGLLGHNSIVKLVWLLQLLLPRFCGRLSLTLWSRKSATFIDSSPIKSLRQQLTPLSVMLDVPQLGPPARLETAAVVPDSEPVRHKIQLQQKESSHRPEMSRHCCVLRRGSAISFSVHCQSCVMSFNLVFVGTSPTQLDEPQTTAVAKVTSGPRDFISLNRFCATRYKEDIWTGYDLETVYRVFLALGSKPPIMVLCVVHGYNTQQQTTEEIARWDNFPDNEDLSVSITTSLGSDSVVVEFEQDFSIDQGCTS